MKTTFDLPDPLLNEARRVAARQNTTLKALVESGLRKVIADSHEARKQFKLKRASVPGHGLQAGAQSQAWGQIIESTYEGRGG